jgi:2-polyprenyl-3-methyl-5-hydroxy-6-metoxy-1,4-benzoquinol methylase
VWAEDPYRDRDLVALYDLDNPAGADHDFYRALAGEVNARTIIDLGCGTGLLTRTLATTGRTVLASTFVIAPTTHPGCPVCA